MKRYSASDRPAVADLSRTIPAGAICVVIGSRSAFSSAAMSCRRCARVPRRRAAGCCSGWMTLRGCTAAYAGDDRADRHRHRHRGRDRRLRGTSLTHAPSWRRRSTTAVVAEAPAPRCEFVEGRARVVAPGARARRGRSPPRRRVSLPAARMRPASPARTCTASRSTSCSPRTTRLRALTAAPCRLPSSPTRSGRPAIATRPAANGQPHLPRVWGFSTPDIRTGRTTWSRVSRSSR